ncbi:MAG: hypothetical protein H6Q10_1264 [Acidobacteria bacterium]|nr:hypothetical protein [Acidobacteriota bacterium]
MLKAWTRHPSPAGRIREKGHARGERLLGEGRRQVDQGLPAIGIERRKPCRRGVGRRRHAAEADRQRRVGGRPLPLRDVGRFGALERQVRVLAVVRQLAAEAGERLHRVHEQVPDGLLRRPRVPVDDDDRVAGERDVLPVQPDPVARQGRAVLAKDASGEAVPPPGDPDRPVGRQLGHLAVRADLDRVALAPPPLEQRAPGLPLALGRRGGHDGEDAGLAEDLADGRRRLAGIEPAEHVVVRIDVKRQRLGGHVEGEALLGPFHPDLAPHHAAGALDRHRDVDGERLSALHLAQRALDPPGAGRRPAGRHPHALQGERGRARACHPVVEEPGEVAPAGHLEHPAEVLERRALPPEVAVEGGERLPERDVAQREARHVEGHERLAVADGFGRGALPRAELAQREVAAVPDVVAVLLQGCAAVLRPRAALLLQQVVGEVRREPLAPVARPVVDEDRVAPPVVQDLVRVRRGEDEGEPDHLGTEQREARHAVARLPEVLDERELRVGVRADQLAVHLDVLRGRRQVPGRQRLVRLVQVDERLDAAGAVAEQVQRPPGQVDLVGRPLRVPPRPPIGAARRAGPLGNEVPALRLRGLEGELDEAGAEGGIPGAARGEVDALGRDPAGGLPEAAGVLLPLRGQGEVDDASVREGEGVLTGAEGNPVPFHRGPVPARCDRRPRRARGTGHFARRRVAGGDGEGRVEGELDRAALGGRGQAHEVGRRERARRGIDRHGQGVRDVRRGLWWRRRGEGRAWHGGGDGGAREQDGRREQAPAREARQHSHLQCRGAGPVELYQPRAPAAASRARRPVLTSDRSANTLAGGLRTLRRRMGGAAGDQVPARHQHP